jgi:hypothetical protein
LPTEWFMVYQWHLASKYGKPLQEEQGSAGINQIAATAFP